MLYLVERVHGDVGFFHLQSSATGTGNTSARSCRREWSRKGAMTPRSKQLAQALTRGAARACALLLSLLVPHTRHCGARGPRKSSARGIQASRSKRDRKFQTMSSIVSAQHIRGTRPEMRTHAHTHRSGTIDQRSLLVAVGRFFPVRLLLAKHSFLVFPTPV